MLPCLMMWCPAASLPVALLLRLLACAPLLWHLTDMSHPRSSDDTNHLSSPVTCRRDGRELDAGFRREAHG